MLRHHRLLAGFAAAMALSACSAVPAGQKPATHDVMAASDAELTGYFAANPIDGAALLGPPPAPDSLAGRADREVYEADRKLAGTSRWTEAARDDDLWNGGALRRYSCALGVRLDDEATPAVTRLLRRIERDVRTVGGPAKRAYDRRRPMLGDDKPICVQREDWMKTNASYPSGHSMTGWAWALVLAEMAPAKADGLLAAGKAVGDSRVICGVHFQSDVEAGRTLSAAMVARMHAEPQFTADLTRAKSELGRAPRASGLDCPAG